MTFLPKQNWIAICSGFLEKVAQDAVAAFQVLLKLVEKITVSERRATIEAGYNIANEQLGTIVLQWVTAFQLVLECRPLLRRYA